MDNTKISLCDTVFRLFPIPSFNFTGSWRIINSALMKEIPAGLPNSRRTASKDKPYWGIIFQYLLHNDIWTELTLLIGKVWRHVTFPPWTPMIEIHRAVFQLKKSCEVLIHNHISWPVKATWFSLLLSWIFVILHLLQKPGNRNKQPYKEIY